MSNKEFIKRKNHICVFPFTGFKINARGMITLCCASLDNPLANIKDIKDLTEFYNSEIMEHYRAKMEDGKITELPVCVNCYNRQKKGLRNMMTIANDFTNWSSPAIKKFDEDWYLRKQNQPRHVRLLEYICSNNCNQSCSTCRSFLSSKWKKIEDNMTGEELIKFERHRYPVNKLSDEDIKKILLLIPHLNLIIVKGGEPWADKNNTKIIEKVLDTNPDCAIIIVSNMQSISTPALKMLEKIKRKNIKLNLFASIDGIFEEYDWIRGGSFQKTVKNMERFYEVTGRKINLIPFISIHNYFSLDKIVEYFKDKYYVKIIFLTGISYGPKYIKLQNLPKEIIQKQTQKYIDLFNKLEIEMNVNHKSLEYEPLIKDIKPNEPFDINALKLSFEWIDVINRIRGFKLEDLVPELQELRKIY